MKILYSLPTFLRRFLCKYYAIRMYDKACRQAEAAHAADPKHRRYFVIGCTNGDLKVTTADEEIRDRRRDRHVLKKSVCKPYVLRKQSFYNTASDVCKRKYVPAGMMDFEADTHRKMFIDWYFKKH